MQAIPLLLIVLGAMLLCQLRAYAYADPGSGLLALQAAGSALIAVGWYLRRRIHALFHRRSGNLNQPEDSPKANRDESSTLQ